MKKTYSFSDVVVGTLLASAIKGPWSETEKTHNKGFEYNCWTYIQTQKQEVNNLLWEDNLNKTNHYRVAVSGWLEFLKFCVNNKTTVHLQTDDNISRTLSLL